MARRSLKPQLNQIRAWVRQGRTDAWIAHQLEVSASELREFRKQHDLTAGDEDTGTGEIDLRDEIEAEIEAATAEEEEEEEEEEAGEEDFEGEEAEGEEGEEEESATPSEGRRRERRPRERAGAGRERPQRERAGAAGNGDGDGQPRRRRRRGRRGGRGRRRPEYQATFDHGERDGYGLWFDPTIKDNPVYTRHWAGRREITVRIDPDQIVIRRPGAPPEDSDG